MRTRGNAIDDKHLKVLQGSKPVDAGGFSLSPQEADSFKVAYPELSDLVHKYIGAIEFLNNRERYCFWLKGEPKARYNSNPVISERLEQIKQARLKSPTKEFGEAASTPELFVQDRQPETTYLVIPRHSSQNRIYLPVGYEDSDVIASDAVSIVPETSLYHFGIFNSLMHNAWMRVTCGRLKSDYRYSPVVYNNMAYPNATIEQKQAIEQAAQAILDTRDSYSEWSLAQLYDPNKMPVNLLAAHKALDKAVEDAYGVDFNGDEEKIVAHLFKLYAEATKGA